MTRERLANTDLLSLEGYQLKIDLDDFVNEYYSRHGNRKIKLHWGDDDIKF